MKATPWMLVSIVFFVGSLQAAEFGLDPRTRDENISGTEIEVNTSMVGDVWLYEYTIHAPESNLGTVQFFNLNLECDEPVDPRGFSEADYRDRDYDILSSGDKVIPAALGADYGASWGMAITATNQAMFSVKVAPGESAGTYRIYSPYGPSQQRYILQPAFPITGRYDYPEDAEFRDDIPKEEDFQVNGLITAPACPSDEPDLEPILFDGSLLPWESEENNLMLRYEAPVRDRFISDSDTVEIIIYYGETIDPKTFKVEPAKGGVRSLFNPEPGHSEMVVLPLREGYNKFKFQVFSSHDGPGRSEASRDVDFFDINHPVSPEKGRSRK